MIYMKDCIHYENVITRRYQFHYSEMSRILEGFLFDIKSLGYHTVGNIFYAMHNVPKDEVMDCEFGVPIKEGFAEVPEGMRFHSYYSIDGMLSKVVLDNFETKMEEAYSSILALLTQLNLIQTTPIYHIIAGKGLDKYIIIKLGYLALDTSREEG